MGSSKNLSVLVFLQACTYVFACKTPRLPVFAGKLSELYAGFNRCRSFKQAAKTKGREIDKVIDSTEEFMT